MTNASGTYSGNDFAAGLGQDTREIDGQNDGDAFNLTNMDVISSVEGLSFSDNGTNFDVTVELSEDHVDLNGTQLSNNLTVTGVAEFGSTETILIDLGSSPEIDLSGWTFIDWGDQGETVQIIGDGSSETITGTILADSIDGGQGMIRSSTRVGLIVCSVAVGTVTSWTCRAQQQV